MLPMCELCSMLFMLDEPLVILALGFVSVDEFVSLAQLTSLLLTFNVLLLLLGVDNRWLLSFSSRRHLALQMQKVFIKNLNYFGGLRTFGWRTRLGSSLLEVQFLQPGAPLQKH